MAGTDSSTFKLEADVGPFVKSIKTANSALKAFDAEAKLATAQYKASGDAETYMTNQTRILNQQIKAQEEIVKQARDGMKLLETAGKENTKEYNQLNEALAKARTELINLRSAANGANAEMETVSKSTDETAKGLEKISSGINFQNLRTGLGKVESLLKNMFSHAVNIGRAIAGWERGAASWADDTLTSAYNAGLDVETYQKWESASGYMDVEINDILNARRKLLKLDGERTVEALDENGKKIQKKIYDTYQTIEVGGTQFAVRIRNANGELLDEMDILWNFIDELQQIPNATQRDAVAMEYFGKNYAALSKLINEGREGWEAAMEKDGVVSEEHVTALGELNDAYQSFDTQLKNLSTTLAAEFAPSMQELLGVLGVVSDQFMDWLKSDEGKEAVKRLGDAVVGLTSGLADIDWASVFQGATDTINNIAELLEGLDGEDIISGLKTVGGIIAGWTISKELMEFYLFAKSFKGLGGGAGGAGAGAGAASGSSAAGATLAGFLGRTALRAMPLTAALWVAEGMLHTTGNDEAELARLEAQGIPTKTIDFYQNQLLTGQITPEQYREITVKMDIPDDTQQLLEDAAWAAEVTGQGKTGKADDAIQEIFADFFAEEAAEAAAAKEAALKEAAENWRAGSIEKNYADLLGEQLIEKTAEDFAKGVAENVKAARMGKSYYDILDEPTYSAEMDEVGWRNYTNYMIAQQMAQALHSGEGIDPDMAGWADQNMDLVYRLWENMFPEDFASDLNFSAQLMEVATQAGEQTSSAFTEGAMENVQAAFAAGAALAAAFASGAASVRPAGGGDTTNNFNSVGNVNVYGAQSPAEIAAAFNGYMADQNAGYGG